MKNNVVLVILFSLVFGLTFSQNSKNILAIGDSNGTFEHGWVNQLKKMLPNDMVYNASISGNTIGFDNLGRPELNTLKNLDNYLKSAQDSLGSIDYLLIMLGTNDAKSVFKDRQNEVISNMDKLITRIQKYPFKLLKCAQLIIMSPPPYGDDTLLEEKYKGGAKRVKIMEKKYKKLAHKNKCWFVNIYKVFKNNFMNYSKDGIHLDEAGQKIIAENVIKEMNKIHH